jgi:hypothetical protein
MPPLQDRNSEHESKITALVSPVGGQTIVLEGLSGYRRGSGGKSEGSFLEDFFGVAVVAPHDGMQMGEALPGMKIGPWMHSKVDSSPLTQAVNVEQLFGLG